MQKATFGAGCFWNPEAIFGKMKGVIETAVGYMGGTKKDPTYRQVCSDNTGHAEVVQVKFDESIVSYEKLLKKFWEIHDPTQLNRQGPDLGSQYRSVIFYHSQEQKKLAEKSKEAIQKKTKSEVVTEIVSAKKFYKAEEYHQKYLEKTGKVCGV